MLHGIISGLGKAVICRGLCAAEQRLTIAMGRVLTHWQKHEPNEHATLMRHWSGGGARILIVTKGEQAAHERDHRTNIAGSVHDDGIELRFRDSVAARAPFEVLEDLAAHEIGHVLQAASGQEFASTGEQEFECDRHIWRLGFSPFSLDAWLRGEKSEGFTDASIAQRRLPGGRYHGAFTKPRSPSKPSASRARPTKTEQLLAEGLGGLAPSSLSMMEQATLALDLKAKAPPPALPIMELALQALYGK